MSLEPEATARGAPTAAAPSPAKAKRGVPRWVWGLVGVGVIAVVVVILFATGVVRPPGQLAAEPPASQPTSGDDTSGGEPVPVTVLPASQPTSGDDTSGGEPAPVTVLPTSQPTSGDDTSGGEPAPVTVLLHREEERVPAGTPVVLKRGWMADTPELVAEYFDAQDFTVTVDGESLPNVADYWREVEQTEDQDGDGDVDYVAFWTYPVGILSPGTHEVLTVNELKWTLTDGLDMDGSGEPDEYGAGQSEWVLLITVEE